MATVTPIDPTTFALQSYEDSDLSLISQFDINTSLNKSSCIEFFIYDINENLVFTEENYTSYTIENDGKSAAQGNSISSFLYSPGDDVSNQGFSQGEYIAYYNFFTKRIGDYNTQLYISEISSDRTELRLNSNKLSNLELKQQTLDFIQFRENQDYFVDFYLNFGSNNLAISNNIKLDNENTSDSSILIKLYEPLPLDFNKNSQVWVVTELNESTAFNVNTPPELITFEDVEPLQGPNYNIPIKNEINNSSQNLSYSDIINGAPSSSTNQIDSLLSQSAINISVDYTNFNDFIHFSSAQTRLENFYYKVGLIETYTSQSNQLNSITSSNSSQLILNKKANNVIKNFDKFEYFMYYNSGSRASWPKSNSKPPYVLYPSTSSQALTWLGSANESSTYFGGLIESASNFDNANPDELKKAIPEYLREDSNNQLYDLFVDMVAQYYDNVWLYTKDITQKYNADNRLDFGVSKDLVSDAIKDFGVKLYQNNFSTNDLYTAFLGITPSGSLFPFPEIYQSTPVPTGFEYVNTLISASNDIIPLNDVNKSLYKRIYHNIPYLLKSKGTITGLRALITSYGIPDTILKISEFGGKDQVNANDYDLYFNNFNYAFDTTNNFITSSWIVNSSWGAASNRPSTVQFRFKAEEFPPTNLSQSLWVIADGTSDPIELRLEYSGSGLTSGSYAGSIKDPYYQYATLRLLPEAGSSTPSASVYLPFFDGGWWSTMVTSNGSTFSLSAGNKIYNGNDGTSLGYYSSSIASDVDDSFWTSANKSYFATSSILNPTTHPAFSGSLQEIRYYNTVLSESVFKDYIMNPLSFEGNGVNTAPDQLIFRAALGSELGLIISSSITGIDVYGFATYGNNSYSGAITTLDTLKFSTSSIHPKVTGSWDISSSFTDTSKFQILGNGDPKNTKNTEILFLDQPAVGIKNRITDKIRSENSTLPSGSVLSPIRSLSQTIEASASYTDSINYLEVAFSPQNQINDDIIGQMGHFNVGDYIGDPRQRSSSLNYYPDLNTLSEDYFKKYIKQYDLVDFVRLIKFFDNSLFKMIKDFIPARTSLASGLVIKQHLLERNKYPQPQVSQSSESYISGSINITAISGGAAGVFNQFNSLTTSPSGSLGEGPNNSYNITQSWSETFENLYGTSSRIHFFQDEFYDGEFSGSDMLITNGELNPGCDVFKEPSFGTLKYGIRSYNPLSSSLQPSLDEWINPENKPNPGYIQTHYNRTQFSDQTFIGVYGIGNVKISKIDGNGNNQRDKLRNLSTLTLALDSQNVRYTVNTISEQEEYFLYSVDQSFPILPILPLSESANISASLFVTSFSSPNRFSGTFTTNLLGSMPGDAYRYFGSTQGNKCYVVAYTGGGADPISLRNNTFVGNDGNLCASSSINGNGTANIRTEFDFNDPFGDNFYFEFFTGSLSLGYGGSNNIIASSSLGSDTFRFDIPSGDRARPVYDFKSANIEFTAPPLI